MEKLNLSDFRIKRNKFICNEEEQLFKFCEKNNIPINGITVTSDIRGKKQYVFFFEPPFLDETEKSMAGKEKYFVRDEDGYHHYEWTWEEPKYTIPNEQPTLVRNNPEIDYMDEFVELYERVHNFSATILTS